MDQRATIKKLEDMLGSGKTKRIDLSEFMQISQGFFEECASCLETGTGREKEELLKDLMFLQNSLDNDVESLAKESGKSPEQMLTYIENPDNFSQDTWQTLQKTWRRLLTLRTTKKRSASKQPKKDDDSSTSGWVRP